ncbi:IS30 family transposase [Micromonospora sp. D93]|uniref:IS30 family transposase n=1 Tax=Micromonospora sp. D93 TaxID=2824886 RepID=UPI001B3972B3|nr:IS30 family transposase [Micromonospora sp. D93]MBQ1022743.1 IS30 family transposase [Micromonospora sp. D93]
MQEGYSSREAAKVVGVHCRTARGWRNGRAPTQRKPGSPARNAPVTRASLSSRYLSEAERIHIADRLREKASLRTIAKELGRDPATISREVRRNGHPDSGDYRPHAAQARAASRRPRPKPGKLTLHNELREFVQDCLDQKWSPEQIVRSIRRQYPDRPDMHLVHETIYLAIYMPSRGGLRREVTTSQLRTRRIRRKPRRMANRRQPRYSTPMTMISERPAEVADRTVPGHWEGDLIIGKDQGSAIGTLVERTTRYLLLVHLPIDRSAAQMRDALIATMNPLPAGLKRSLTWDQGSEMGLHHQFTKATSMPVYFCTPASPWQRGTNENTNGLLRQYFPKGTDLSGYTADDLAAVAAELNARPRKALGWESPTECLSKLLASAQN